MKAEGKGKSAQQFSSAGGLVGLVLKPLLTKLRAGHRIQPRLELLERITLAPRQSLALVEAEGRRFLVATSAEGGPAFFALDSRQRPALRRGQRVSW
jgi:flagellar biogenesis protein FliO